MTKIQVGAGSFRFTVDESWAKFPANGAAGEAVGVACDSRDRVYVFLRGPQPVLVFEPDGTPAAAWGEGVFVRPHGIFIGPDDTVYCTDDFGHTVRAFSTEGKLRFTLGSGKPSDTGATSIDYRTIKHAGPPFNFPTNMAIGPAGDLYVSDGYGNARIHHFAPDGRLIHSWGEPGSRPSQFYVPHGIAVDRAGTVYVADRENSRIQLFTDKGVYVGEWTDIVRPCQIFIDKAGWFYVAELGYRAGRWPGTGPAAAGAGRRPCQHLRFRRRAARALGRRRASLRSGRFLRPARHLGRSRAAISMSRRCPSPARAGRHRAGVVPYFPEVCTRFVNSLRELESCWKDFLSKLLFAY